MSEHGQQCCCGIDETCAVCNASVFEQNNLMPEENISQTPRTDAAEATRSCLECGVLRYVDADFCRELERTVNSTRDTNKRLRLENHAERAENARFRTALEKIAFDERVSEVQSNPHYSPSCIAKEALNQVGE